MSWTDSWTFCEDGVLIKRTREEVSQHIGYSLACIHDSHDEDPLPLEDGPSDLTRSKSLGNATSGAAIQDINLALAL